jgi:Zn-finger nucleic acid-binding protein
MAEKKPTKIKTRTIALTRQLVIEQKTCPQCGKVFDGAKVAKFCSRLCANNAAYARNADQYRATRRAKYQAEKKTAGKK